MPQEFAFETVAVIDQPSDPAHAVIAHLRLSAQLKLAVAETCLGAILGAGKCLVETFHNGGKVLLCGNGGSAADCQHLAAEFVSRLSADLERPAMAAIALTTDTSVLTARANDYSFNQIFSRQVEALGRPGDVLVAISTSGNSANVVEAVLMARRKKIGTVGLLGCEGGQLASLIDAPVIVPSHNTQHVQECHIAISHILCSLVEQTLFNDQSR